jgi:hypothetical protein
MVRDLFCRSILPTAMRIEELIEDSNEFECGLLTGLAVTLEMTSTHGFWKVTLFNASFIT